MAKTTVEIINWSQLKIGDALADGSFATVYRAVYKDQPVAVKKWKVQEVSSRELELFKREVEANALFSHSNIVKFIGVCVEPISIVTELVEGQDLWEIVHNEEIVYDMSQFVKVALAVAKGLAHIHEKGQIHRDLKSLNLLINKDWDAKVCDFGLARFVQKAAKLTGGCGTVQWMAPEVIMHNDYDDSVDAYSYGVVMWEMLARQAPYAQYRNEEMKIASAVAQHGERPAIPDWVPPKVADLMRRCWEEDPKLRPSFKEIIAFWESGDAIPADMLHRQIKRA